MNRRSFVFPPLLLLGACRSARQELRPIVRIAVAGRAALDYLPIYLASALGFFRGAGIDVDIQDLASGPKALQALLGGSTDLVAAAYEGALRLSMRVNPSKLSQYSSAGRPSSWLLPRNPPRPSEGLQILKVGWSASPLRDLGLIAF